MSFTNDKFLHFTISFLLVPFFLVIVSNLGYATLLALLVGFVKETYDHFSPHHTFDIMDILFNILGITFSISFLLFIGVM